MCGYYINIIATSEGQSKSTSIIFWKHHLITNIRQIGETEIKGERERKRREDGEKKERKIDREKKSWRQREREARHIERNNLGQKKKKNILNTERNTKQLLKGQIEMLLFIY